MYNKWAQSNQGALQQSHYNQVIDNLNVPNYQSTFHIRDDEYVGQPELNESPIKSQNRSQVKNSQDVLKSNISKKYERIETSYSPLIKSHYQRDVSPQFKKIENHKLIESYEGRVMKLSQENGELQSQLFSDQQKYNQIIIDFEHQTKCLEQKLNTEIMNIQQHKLLIQNKNEEINTSTSELLRLEQKYFNLETKMFQQQKEMGILKQQNDAKSVEIDNLRKYIKDLQVKNLREQEELKIQTDNNICINYELQIKEIQMQHGNNIAKLNDLLQQEQFKFNRLQNQFEQQTNELKQQNIQLDDLKIEKVTLYEENIRLQRFLDEIKMQQQELLKESNSQRDRQMQQDKNHQISLTELKSHYEQMKKSQVIREIKEVTIQFQAERLNYESQIRSLNQRLIELDGKISQKQAENQELLIQNQEIESELRNYVQNHEHYKRIKENQLQEQQIEQSKQKQQQNDILQKNQNQQNEIQTLNQIINDLKIQIDIVKSQSQEFQKQFQAEHESDLQNQKTKQQNEIRQLNIQLNDLKNELQQHHMVLKQKDETLHQQKLDLFQKQGVIDGLLSKLDNQDKLKNQEIQQYQSEIENSQKEQNLFQIKLKNDKNLLEQQLKQLKQRINDLETQQIRQEFNNNQFKQELEQQLQQKEFQLQQLQNEKNNINSQFTVIKQKMDQSNQIISELREQNQQLGLDIEDQKQQNEIDRAQFIKKELSLENKIQQLKSLINQREQELQQYLSELENTNNRVRQYELITEQSQDEFKRRENQFVQEIANLKQRMDTTQQRYSEYQSMKETLQEQVQSVQETSQNKERQIEEQEKMYEEYNSLQRKYEQQKDDLQSFEQKQIKFHTQKMQLERQIEKLNQELELKDKELKYQDELNRKSDQFIIENSKDSHDLVEVQAQLSSKNEQIDALKRENEDLQIQLDALQKSYEQLNNKNQELLEILNEAKQYTQDQNAASKVTNVTTLIKSQQIQLNTQSIPEEESQHGTERSDQQFQTAREF